MSDEERPLTFSARPHTTTLPSDAEVAVAAVLAYTRGEASFLPTTDVDRLRERIEKLRDPTAPGSLDELARHLPILENVWLSLAVAAQEARNATDRAKLTRAALQTFEAFSRGFALLRGMELQRDGACKVVVHDGSCDD